MMLEGRAASAGAGAAAMAVHIAIVHVPGYVCHVVADTTLAGVNEKLGAYVGEHCTQQLLDGDAARVRELLSELRTAEAVALYFDRVGLRWDPERLHAVELDVDLRSGGGREPQ